MSGNNPIQSQPVADRVSNIYGDVNPGLQCLSDLDRVVVKQQVDLCEVCVPCWTNSNSYEVKDSNDRCILFAEEDNGCCILCLCGPQGRPFDMPVKDTRGQEVIRYVRPYRCGNGCVCCSCLGCCYQKIEVYSNTANDLLGTVEEEFWLCTPKFSVKDSLGKLIFTIEGSTPRLCTCCCTMDFNIITASYGDIVGKISKISSGYIQETFTTADNFSLTFPPDLAVEMKAVLLGACFLIDFMYYERRKKRK